MNTRERFHAVMSFQPFDRLPILISCDHQTPPRVSYQEYVVYLSLFREYAEKAAEGGQQF